MTRGRVTLIVMGAVAAAGALWPQWAGAQQVPASVGVRIPVVGEVQGAVVTAAQGRVAVRGAEGGQMILQPLWQPIMRRLNPRQLEFINALKQGDVLRAMWKQDEDGSYRILAIAKLGPDGQPAASILQLEGRASGVVVTASEERLVVQMREGGQITLEARRQRVNGQVSVLPDQAAFLRTLKQGEEIDGYWTLGDGDHYIIAGLARPGAVAPMDQIRSMRSDIAALRREIAALRDQFTKLLP